MPSLLGKSPNPCIFITFGEIPKNKLSQTLDLWAFPKTDFPKIIYLRVVRHSLTFSRGNELDSYQKSNMKSKIAYLLSFFPIHSQSRMLYFQGFYIKKDPIESAFTLLQGLLLNLFYFIFRASTHCLFTM